jgi:hypothetical protein
VSEEKGEEKVSGEVETHNTRDRVGEKRVREYTLEGEGTRGEAEGAACRGEDCGENGIGGHLHFHLSTLVSHSQRWHALFFSFSFSLYFSLSLSISIYLYLSLSFSLSLSLSISLFLAIYVAVE